MAKYTTSAKMQLRIDPQFLLELCDDLEVDDITNATVVAVMDRAIEDASNDIDSYVFGELDMSVSANQNMVEPKCSDMALYRLYARRYHDNDSNPARDSNSKAFSWLRGVQKGLLHTDDDPLRPGALVSTNTDIDDRIFDKESLDKL